jgi:DNA-binding NtrC family response regulator
MTNASVHGVDARVPPIDRGGFSPPGCKYSTKMASILIVDDESLIRWSLAQTLEAEGFTVVEAASARETLDWIDKNGDIGVVLLDLKLPDSSDLSLLRTLRQRAPGWQIILMTAHGTTEILDEAIDAGAFRALGKPFDMGYMVEVVRDAMAA